MQSITKIHLKTGIMKLSVTIYKCIHKYLQIFGSVKTFVIMLGRPYRFPIVTCT
jgi:hypothetical protein